MKREEEKRGSEINRQTDRQSAWSLNMTFKDFLNDLLPTARPCLTP